MDFLEWLENNFGKIWVIGVIISLAFTGFGVWAVYRLVMHFT